MGLARRKTNGSAQSVRKGNDQAPSPFEQTVSAVRTERLTDLSKTENEKAAIRDWKLRNDNRLLITAC